MLKEMNKRGQEMSTTTIILLVLGILILVILILGFTIGWNKFAPFLSSTNVDNVKNSCESACTGVNQYTFCTSPRDLNADGVQIKKSTCNYLAVKQPKYGIKPCTAVTCDNIVYVDIAKGGKLNDSCVTNPGMTVQALVGNTLQSVDCSSNSTA